MKLLVCALALLLSTPILAQTANSDTPTGQGDPNAIVCRAPQLVPGSRLMGPQVCRLNSVWAQYYKDGLDVTADGNHVAPSEKRRSITMKNCHTPLYGGGTTIGAMSTAMGIVCD